MQFAGAVNTLKKGTAFIISAAQLYSLPGRSWKKEFLILVRSAGEKDPEYRKALEELEAEKNVEAAQVGPVPDGRKGEENQENEENEENGEVAWAGPVPDGCEAKENGKAVWAGSVPNGQMAKDKKAV